MKRHNSDLQQSVNALSRMMGNKDYASAVDFSRALIRRHAKDPLLHNILGVALAQDGRAADAVRPLQRAVTLSPAYDEALGNLISVLVGLERLTEAVPYLRRAIDRDPGAADKHRMLAAGLYVDGDLHEALACVEQSLTLQPGNLAAMNTRGAILQEMQRFDEAQQQFQAILDQDPEQADAHFALGEIHLIQGRKDEAIRAIWKALKANPDLVQAYQTLATVHRFQPGDPLITRMQERFDDPNSTDQARMYLGFALAKAQSDIGAHDKVFEPLRIGNAQKRRQVEPFSPARRRKQIQRIKSLFNPAAIERLRTAAHDSRVPIFVLGMPRSGTTLVEQILAAHPCVHGAGELPDIEAFGETLIGAERLPGPDKLRRFADGYVGRLQALAPPGITHVVDKMPANADWIGLIRGLFPNARIIRTRRDPRDTGLSIYRALFATDGVGWAYDLRDIAQYLLQHDALMDHWSTQFPGAIHEVSYEDLTADPEPAIRALAEFCELEWDPSMLAPEQVSRAVLTVSAVQVRRSINRDSVGGWQRYAEDLAPLLETLARAGFQS